MIIIVLVCYKVTVFKPDYWFFNQDNLLIISIFKCLLQSTDNFLTYQTFRRLNMVFRRKTLKLLLEYYDTNLSKF